MTNGVFWIVDGELLAYPFDGATAAGVAKSGNTYNHKLLWAEIRPCSKPYDYYPRGRVDVRADGTATIWCNPNVDVRFFPQIKAAFGLTAEPTVRYDFSEHYKCDLDRDG